MAMSAPTPERIRAYCYACRALTFMIPPLPPLQIRGRTTLREGACADCGAPTYRIGGARGADGESRGEQ
jgi:hypothetical protein